MTVKRTKSILLAAMLILAISPTASASPVAPGLMKAIEGRYDDMLKAVRSTDDKEAQRTGLRKAMDAFVDFDEMGRRTMAGTWDSLNAKQRKAFIAEFKQLIQRTYVRRFDAEQQFEVEYKGEPETEPDGAFLVHSIIRAGRSEVNVDYRFHRKGKAWWAFDVVIDDVSMIRNYRKQFHDIQAKEGFDGLMARLVKRNREQAE
jgi:phospholipid transport system substrate-binding protein